MNDRIDLKRSLNALAYRQGGYFTARQALGLGFSYQAQKYHVDRGNWSKIDRALFRLPDWPHTASDEFARWFVWSHGNGVVSHQSAARAHLLGDFVNAPVHLTMPPGKSPANTEVVLHVATLRADEVIELNGFRATSVIKTLSDLAAGDTDEKELQAAARQASVLYQPLLEDLRLAASRLDPGVRGRLNRAFLWPPVSSVS
jgi:predicted transcriptional regulator of viral defense system